MKDKLSKFEAISLILIITATEIILNMPEYLVDLTGTGTIINILYITIIGSIICLVIFKLLKNFPSMDILDIAETLGGNILKFLLAIIFIIFFIFSTVLAISNFSYLIKSLYFSNYTSIFITFFFIAVIIFSNLRGFQAIKKIICIFIPIIILSIIFLGLETADTFDINNFFPILGYNTETTFITGLQNILVLNFLWVYFFILPNLKRKNDLKSIMILSFIINIVLIIISVIAILSLFPTLVTKQISTSSNLSTIYLITRRIRLNSFIEQTDILFLFIWTCSIFAYISFLIHSALHVLNKLFVFENKSQAVFPISSIILGLCLIINKFSIIKYLESNVLKYFFIILIRNLLSYLNFRKFKKEEKIYWSKKLVLS